MLHERGLQEPEHREAGDRLAAAGADIVRHAHMDVAVASVRRKDRRVVIDARGMAVLAVMAIRVWMRVRMRVWMRVWIRISVRNRHALSAAVDRDAQHPPRRHAGADLREQEERQEDACDQLFHARSDPRREGYRPDSPPCQA